MNLLLPNANGRMTPHPMSGKPLLTPARVAFTSRIAYAAAHVVVDPWQTRALDGPVIDWESTLAFRRHLWSLGFGVAEAMDTAQRGMGLGWEQARELIERSAQEAAACGGLIASGAGTDHLDLTQTHSLADIIAAYIEQCAAIEAAGSRIILMASRALVRAARSADDYRHVYTEVLRQARQTVILHWLGPMFDPALTGYWGTTEIPAALETCLSLIDSQAARIDGIKVSLLDADLEIAMRRRLPAGVRMYTGDDFNFDRLIAGEAGERDDAHGHSDALLGIFDPIAPAAALALQALDAGDRARYDALLAPTVPLSRHLFETPTFYYKTGIVFLAYLNGFQPHFRMVAGAENGRSVAHLVEAFRLADAAGLLRDPEMAAERMTAFLNVSLGRSRA